jgi:phosphate starvation-inducible protein PhoH
VVSNLVWHMLYVYLKIKEIHITRFHSRDVVRHQLVQKIVEAYEGWDSEQHRLMLKHVLNAKHVKKH